MTFLSDGAHPPSFSGSTILSGYGNPFTITSAFLDSDSCLDIVVGSRDGQALSWLQSDCASTPTYAQNDLLVYNYQLVVAVETGDVNNDGWVDIVRLGYDQTPVTYGLVYYLSSGGASPSFAVNITVFKQTANWYWAMALADMNGDGYLDMLLSLSPYPSGSPSVVVYQSDGGAVPKYTARTVVAALASVYNQFVVSDFDHDGNVDFAAESGSDMSWFRSSGGTSPTYSPTLILHATVSGFTAADLDGDGYDDLVSTVSSPSSLLRLFQNSGAGPGPVFTAPRTVPNSFASSGNVKAGDLNGDGAVDIVTSIYVTSGTEVSWYQSTACTLGTYSGTGNQPCSPCPAGTFGAVTGLATSLCSGYCPIGQYSTSGAAACAPCPVGRYGDVVGLTSALCAGPCVAAVAVSGAGSGCDSAGATAPTGSICRTGTYSSGSSGGSCVPCPAGRYGNTLGLTTASCTGACAAVAGSFCGAGATAATGDVCPPGQYSDVAAVSACTPCPAGVYGGSGGQTSSNCTDSCVAPAGSYCPPGATSPTGLVCPKGSYSTGGASGLCTPCPAGRFGGRTNLTSANCSGACAVGSDSYAGAEVCVVCPFGTTTGNTTGQNSSACSGRCTAKAGSYCVSNATAVLCPAGYYTAGEVP